VAASGRSRLAWAAVLYVALLSAIALIVRSGNPSPTPPLPARTLGRLTADPPVSAVGDWLAWSVQRRDGWHLETLHEGRLATPRIAPSRDLPFDLDLGTDAAGRPVATFSRCPNQTQHRPVLVRCRVRVVDLEHGIERDAGVPAGPEASDRVPSMWRGQIAFARYVYGGDPDVDQIFLYTPGHAGLRRLGFQAVHRCHESDGCTSADDLWGRAYGMDLGERRLAVLWDVGGSGSEDSAAELRVVRLDDPQSTFVAFGYAEEVCGETTDTVTLASPVVDGDDVYFTETDSECYDTKSYIVHLDGSNDRLGAALSRRPVMQIAHADDTLYGLIARRPHTEVDPACTPRSPCRLRRLAPPAFDIKPSRNGLPVGLLTRPKPVR
jgi:hypothetical protein